LLQFFSNNEGTLIIQYVDDLLISGETQEEVIATTIALLNFLGEQGLRVSKKKLQFVKQEVKYLGHWLSQGTRKLDPDRIKGILSIPPATSKREVRKLL
ncbi:POLY protein, partial [Circaetus pectoralis]|nr:POLY protein [Circaetus pectoralis]